MGNFFCVDSPSNRYITGLNIKALRFVMLAEESNKEFGLDGCHLKNTCHIDLLFHMHILEVYVQICVRYEDSIFKAINGTRCTQTTPMMMTTIMITPMTTTMTHDRQIMIA